MAAPSAAPSGGAPSKHALHEAVERDDVSSLSALLRPRVTPSADPSFPPIELPPLGLNLRDPLGATPLHVAVLSARPRALSLLLAAGARANLPLEGIPLLCLACAAGSLPGRREAALECIDLLLQHDVTLTKCPPHERDDANRSALHWAVEAGLAEAPPRLAARALQAAAKQARRLAQARGDEEAAMASSDDAIAKRAGEEPTAERAPLAEPRSPSAAPAGALLRDGHPEAPPSSSSSPPTVALPSIPALSSLQDKWGDLALHVAARLGDADALRALFAAAWLEGRLRADGAGVRRLEGDETDGEAERRWNELIMGGEGAWAGGKNAVRDPTTTPRAEIFAAADPSSDAPDASASPNPPSPSPSPSPSSSSLSAAGRSTLSSLLHLRALLSTRNRQGLTPLAEAASVGALGAVRLLARAAPDEVSRRDRRGKTPAQLARERGHERVAAWLEAGDAQSAQGAAGGAKAGAKGEATAEDALGDARVPEGPENRRGVLVLAPPECWAHLTTTEVDLARGRDAWEELPPENVARLAAILGQPGISSGPVEGQASADGRGAGDAGAGDPSTRRVAAANALSDMDVDATGELPSCALRPALASRLRSLSPFGGLLRDPRLAALGVRVDARPGRRAAMTDVLRVHDWAYVKGLKDLSERAQDTLAKAERDAASASAPQIANAGAVAGAGEGAPAQGGDGAGGTMASGASFPPDVSSKSLVPPLPSSSPSSLPPSNGSIPSFFPLPLATPGNPTPGLVRYDGDTVISAGTWRAALAAAGAAIDAVDLVLAPDASSSSPRARAVFCATRPPGHHAGPTGMVPADVDQVSSNGFCLLNNAAIAAAYALCMHRGVVERVAILDFDVHHGNGTQACVVGAVPSVVSTPLVTPWATGTLEHPVWRPWLDDGDRNRIFFASIQGFGPKEVGEGGVVSPTEPYIYPGSGATGDNWDQQTPRGEKTQRNAANATPSATPAPNGRRAQPEATPHADVHGNVHGNADVNADADANSNATASAPHPAQSSNRVSDSAAPSALAAPSPPPTSSTVPPPPSSSSSSSSASASLLPAALFPSFSGPPPAPLEAPRVIDVGIGGPGPRPGAFRRAWRDKVLTALDAFAPSLIVICAGFDAHRKDILNHRFIGLSEPDYRWATDLVMQVAERHCPGRVVSILEGGYRIQGGPASAFARSVAAHVRAMAEPSTKRWSQEEQDAERIREEKHAEERERTKREKKERAERELKERAERIKERENEKKDPGAADAHRDSTTDAAGAADAAGTGVTASRRGRRRRSEPVDYAALNAKMEKEARAAKKAKENK